MDISKFALLLSLLMAGDAVAGDGRALVVNEGALGKTHALAAGARLDAPGYPAAYADSGDDVCIALGYTVKADGSTGDFKLLKAWASNRGLAEVQERYLDTFASAGADAVSKWRFTAKNEAFAQPVRTVATLTFHGTGRASSLGDHCRIDDLAAFYDRLENGRVAARRISDDQRKAAAMTNIRHAEAVARRRFGQNTP